MAIIGERALILAIIDRAVSDAAGCFTSDGVAKGEREQIFASAWAFLTDRRGKWAQARHDVCSAVDINPDWLADHAEEFVRMRREKAMRANRSVQNRDGRK